MLLGWPQRALCTFPRIRMDFASLKENFRTEKKILNVLRSPMVTPGQKNLTFQTLGFVGAKIICTETVQKKIPRRDLRFGFIGNGTNFWVWILSF